MSIEGERIGRLPSGINPELAPYVLPLSRSENYYTDARTGIMVYLPMESKATRFVFGNPDTDVAICSSWLDPWEIADREILEQTHFVAPMRTLTGLEIALVNLARNPKIRRIVIWNGGQFDNNRDALIPREHLLKLFDKESGGIEDDGTIKETQFKLRPELVENGGLEIIRRIIANVSVVATVATREDLVREIQTSKQIEPYMEPFVFPEFKIHAAETLPSEEVIMVRQKTIPDAWLRLMWHAYRYGRDCQLETDGARVRELGFVRVVIDSLSSQEFSLPLWASEIVQLGLTEEKLDEYFRTKILPFPYEKEVYPSVRVFERPKGISYLYSELLFYYPTRPEEFDDFVKRSVVELGVETVTMFLKEVARRPRHDADEIAANVLRDKQLSDFQKVEIILELYIPPVNQIQQVIERINQMPDDADKVAFLWVPDTHGVRDHGRPCFTQAAFLVRDGKVDMKVNFRSHDIPKGWLENVYGIWRLQVYIARETGYRVGRTIVDSESGHIYQSDLDWVKEVVNSRIIDQLPTRIYQSETMADPRGNWLINNIGGKTICILQDPQTGRPLSKPIDGRTFNSIWTQVRHLGLFADSVHAMYFGAEVQKAVLCNLVGMPYVQDMPLDFRRIREGLTAVAK
jgi:hypothetical protein